MYTSHDPDSFYSQPPQPTYDGYPDNGVNDSRLLGDSLHDVPGTDSVLRAPAGAHDAYQGLSFTKRDPHDPTREAPYEPLYMHSRTAPDASHAMSADVTESAEAFGQPQDSTPLPPPPDVAPPPPGDSFDQQFPYRYTSAQISTQLRNLAWIPTNFLYPPNSHPQALLHYIRFPPISALSV